MKVSLAYASDRGKKRENNEDRGCVHRVESMGLCLLAVADGMGGHEGGEIASALAIEVVEKCIGELTSLPESPESYLASVFDEANDVIARIGAQRQKSLGTTLTVGLLCDDILHIGHVGDCRVYRLRPDGWMDQVTEDHSWTAEGLRDGRLSYEEAAKSPYHNVLVRFLGKKPMQMAYYVRLARKDDTYLFCSDGLHGYVSDREIQRIVLRTSSVERIPRRLIRIANRAGGHDNVTVVAMRFG